MITCNMPVSKAQTLNEVNGIISSNVTLAKADGPYRFEEVVVSAGATLTIEAGSSVYISGYLQVNGTMIAKGTPTQQIYFTNDGSNRAIRFWSTSANSIIENAVISGIPVQISSSVTIRGSYLKGSQAQNSIYINSGSPIVTNNTIKGTLDGYAVVRVQGGSPTISNNNLLGYGDLPLNSDSTQSSPFTHYSSEEPMYGVYVTDAIGGEITNNRCYGNTDGIKVESGTITVNGNTMHTNEYIAFPSGQPSPPTPTSTPPPTLPPYPLPSQSSNSNPITTNPTVIPTINTGPIETGAFNLLTIAIGVIIAAVAIIASLIALLVVLLRKNRKEITP
jgi:parallel beta-helix repeat protein